MLSPEEKPYLSVNIMQSQCFWAARNRSQSRTRSRGWSETDEKQEEIKLHVCYPMTHIENEKAVFTDYRIEIKTVGSLLALSYSSVRRRFSEFVWLDNHLRMLPEANVPFLPNKKVFGRFEVDFILRRQRGLEDYLRRVIEDEVLLGNAHLHFFLQTNFTPNEIEHTLSRKDHEDVNHIIILATADLVGEHLHGNGLHQSISDSALESSYSSLDISDVTPETPEVLSSGYFGDDEDTKNDKSESATEIQVAQKMLDIEPVFSSYSESELSFEEFFEFDDKVDKNSNYVRKSKQGLKVKTLTSQGLIEYLMPMSESKSETYVVFGNSRNKGLRPRRDTNTKRIKKLVNEYEVVSIL